MLLDFDPRVVGYSSQPLWLHWDDGDKPRRHCPDYFARLDDGTGLVVDVRADDNIDDAADGVDNADFATHHQLRQPHAAR